MGKNNNFSKKSISLNKEHYEKIFEASPDAIVILDENDRILKINQKFEDMFEYSPEEAIGRRINALIVPEDKKEEGEEATEKVAEGKEVFFETVRESKSGKKIDVSILGSPVELKGKRLIVYGIYRDITERVKAKKELKEREEKYRTLFEYSGTAICIFGDDKVIKMCNKKFAELVGLTKEKIENKKKWSDFVSKKDLKRMKKYHRMRTENRGNPPNEYEFDFIDNDNNLKHIHFIIKKVKGSKERVASLLDITDFKEAQQKLKKSEKKYRLLYNSIRDAILVADKNRIITDCNSSFTKLFGYEPEEIIGKKTLFVYADKKEYEDLGSKIKQNYGDSPFLQIQYYKRKNGESFPGETAVYYLKDEKGNVTGFIGLIRDISERLRLQEQLRQSQKMESIGRLAGGIAHDMNNLLMPIMGYTKMLSEKKDISEEYKKVLLEITKASKKAKSLVKQLLALGKKQKLEKKVVNINNIVDDFKRLIRKAVREDIKIVYNLKPKIDNIRADRNQLEQVIMNIFLNAQDAISGEGQITLETDEVILDESYTSSYQDFDPGEYVKISIHDTGEGIEKENIDKIYDPFFTTKGEQGSGLGLSTAYGIIKQHYGDIHVYSEPKKGATFNIYLPSEKKEIEKSTTSKKNKKKIDLKGIEKILVAEDNMQIQELIKNFLGEKGYRVVTAVNGEEAYEKAKKSIEKFDLIITDVIMPELNGYELYKKIKKIYPDIEVIFMSGYPKDILNQYGLEMKDISYLRKPFSVNKLALLIKKILSK